MQQNDRASQRHLKIKLSLLSLVSAMALMGAFSVAAPGDRQIGSDLHFTRKCDIASYGTGCIAGLNVNSHGIGVYGHANGHGVGVAGRLMTGTGVGTWGVSDSDSGVAVQAEAAKAGGLALFAVSDQTGNGTKVVYSQGESGFAYTDDEGNMTISGQYFEDGDCNSGCSQLHRVVSFGARSSEPTIEDFGESALRNGTRHVSIGAAFANVIDQAKSYLVTLTPEGDAEALYVTNRTARGFDVRESRNGHSSISFTYRILARPYGAPDARLPLHTEVPPRQMATN